LMRYFNTYLESEYRDTKNFPKFKFYNPA
jgi:hypothetical protein